MTNQEGDQMVNQNAQKSDAALVRNFANQFNLNLNMENIDNKKESKKKKKPDH